MMPLSRADLLKALLPGLNKLFGAEYAKVHHTEYHMKSRYGKYSIYKWDFNGAVRINSATLAKGLSKEEASGMMKLLGEPE
jgi:hypothetical protein